MVEFIVGKKYKWNPAKITHLEDSADTLKTIFANGKSAKLLSISTQRLAGNDGYHDFLFEGMTYTQGIYDDRFILANGKQPKVNPIKYMSYGTGCNNKGNFLTTEKELRAELTKLSENRDWSGELIGYKLTPLFKIKKVVKFEKY